MQWMYLYWFDFPKSFSPEAELAFSGVTSQQGEWNPLACWKAQGLVTPWHLGHDKIHGISFEPVVKGPLVVFGLYRGWNTTQLYRDYNKPL